MKILLLHARDPDDPSLTHEYECFVARSGEPADSFVQLNLTTHTPLGPELFDGVDCVMVGGSGAYSLTKGGADWFEPMLELMREIVARRVPLFASCFGFQALVVAMGGELRADPERAELGTYALTLTDAGRADPLFSELPDTFDVQLGHNDSVVSLPDGLVNLASTERCLYQSVRVPGAPIYATQFHPELTDKDNILRYMRYLEHYIRPGETIEDARHRAYSMHRPSPDANAMIRRFLSLI
jgi:GMP synthase (glutamine-hydrolysing)